MVLRGGTILMVAGWFGVGQKLILRMFPRSSVGAWADSWGVCSHAVGRRNSVSPFVECGRNYAAWRYNSIYFGGAFGQRLWAVAVWEQF